MEGDGDRNACSTPDVVASCRADNQRIIKQADIMEDAEERTCSAMESIQEFLHILKLHTEVDRLTHALSDLNRCLNEPKNIDDDLLSNLERQRVQEDILICMHNFQTDENVQKLGCELLSTLVHLSTGITNDMVNKDTHQRIFRVLLSHPADVDVQVAALTTLSLLAEVATVRRKLLTADGDVVGHLLLAISTFPDQSQLLCKLFLALRVIIQDDANVQSDLVRHGDHKQVLTSVRRHENDRDMVREACRLLHLLSSEATIFLGVLDGIVQILINDEVHEVMADVMYRFFHDEDILEPALEVISVLSIEEEVALKLASTVFESALLSISMKFHDSNAILIHVFNIMDNLLSYDDELTYERGSNQSVDWLRQVYTTMGHHRDDPDLQDACCRVLARLMELYPELNQSIGEDPDQGRYPVQNLCFGALLMHESEANVVISSCNAIYWMSADHEYIQNLLVQKNAFVAICHTMRAHKTDSIVQEAGCRALRGLCIFSQENKEKIAWNIDLSDLFRPLMLFPENSEVQIEVIAIIATLADTELVRSKCTVEDIHQTILVAIENHENVPLLQEVSLEALAILCAADGGAAVLNECQAIEKVLITMKIHALSQAIQRKGLVLLQILIDDYEFGDEEELPSDIVKVITAGMTCHEDEVGIMTEACVTMLILLERSPFTAVEFVNNNAHGRMFYILENLKEHSNLVDLADECLYLLYSCDAKMKSQMLIHACAQGITRGVECLIQLGADVNAGSGSETPLCHACLQGDDHTAGILLQQGVTDLQTPLQLALHADRHNITGMILSHLGYDQQAGIVSWSGLDLGDVRPEWLEPTFLGGSGSGRLLSAKGEAMARRVRRSEERRQRRYSRHHSEPGGSGEPRATRRLSLRYSFNSNRSFGTLEEYVQKLEEGYQDDETPDAQRAGTNSGEVPRGKGPLAFIKRTVQNFRNRRKSSPNITTPVKKPKRKKSDLIKSISTTKLALMDKEGYEGGNQLVEIAEFAQSPEELREWKEYTLTGSNVPFSPLDPRRSTEKVVYNQPRAVPGEWQRKSPFNVSRRRSDSMLMLYKTSGTSRSLKLHSLSSQQGDGDDSSTNSQQEFSPSFSDSGLSNAWSPRHRSSGRKRASTWKTSSIGDEIGRMLSPIKDKPSLPTSVSNPSLNPVPVPVAQSGGADNPDDVEEDDVFEVPRSSSELHLLTALPSPAMGSRRCRSVTLGEAASVESSGRHVIHVDLSNNKIQKLDKLVADGKRNLLDRFKLMEKLDLSQNLLKIIPECLLKQLLSVQQLNLSQNQISAFPTTALNCKHLATLNLSNNQIEHIDLLGNRINISIKELDLSHNILTAFPKSLAKTMPNLESLNLSGNKITDLPFEPLVLKSLRMLDLSHNFIRVIPDLFLTQTSSLETLILTCNEIESLPSEDVALVLPKLAVVKLSNNNIAVKEPFYIPKFLLELESLRSIALDHNQLAGLPEPTLWKATGIREIFASHNEIKKLNLGSQPRLWATVERLSLSHNKLIEITRDIGQLTSLTSLDISYNEKISTIPDEMGRLQKLWEFPLDGLKLDLDEGLVKGRTKDLVGYLHEKLKRSVEYYHMKMMVVGYGGRGKSTLLRALRKQKQLEKSIPTVGVVVRDWKFRGRGRKPGLGHVTYTLSTWDFAGQEEFYATHQCFLSNRALYLVVYNLAKGVSEAEKLRPWLLNIQARAPNCPVIVVGTHLDNIPKDGREAAVNETRQRITEMCECPGFPELKGLTEVCATKEGQVMERLRALVKDVLDNFKIKGQAAMGQKIPESYVRLQELLSEEARNLRTSLPIIRHPRLLKIAKDAGLALDEDELHQAVRFLHESGSLLHYDDAALQLNSYYFIDPEWLCRMMAQVVTVREINPFITPLGILKRENVRHLFTGKRVGADVPYTFPAYLIPQYLKLLEKFEIALPQNDDELLIPSRLPVQRPLFRNALPAYVKNGHQSPNQASDTVHMFIERRYELTYTPIGFWSRLLTRLLVFISTLLPELDLSRQEPIEIQYWREGIYVYYGPNAYFLVASDQLVDKAITVTVPSTRPGSRLLGELVDHIDALIEEWYPGLQEVSPTGELLVKRKAPCPICHDYVFELEDLISESDLNDSTECPFHKGVVPLSILAPDIVLGDMEEKYKLNLEEFVFVQSPEHVLGDGTFGCVYRAKYKNQVVAVKLFNSLGEGHPYKMMRQEAGILRRLHHPSLICMLGVGLHPRVLLLELAPLGALGSLLKSKRVISRSLQHRIATQVCDGLKFLHEHNIIYRDMKPDNILIFNLSLTVVINAKISDYGISRLATAYGLTLPEGTPGYRGPEVIRGESYSFQADIYSLGVTMYELVTGGQHPFSDLNFRSEIDDAILSGRRVEPVTKRGATPWPDMEDVIDHCLHPIPEKRPTSGQLLEQLRSVDFLSLRRTVAVSKGVSVECMAVRGYGESDLEVWVASGDKEGAQLSWLSLTAHAHEPKGVLLTGSRILSITTVGQSSMLLGTQDGNIRVYDAWQHTCKHTLPTLADSVLCLQHYAGYQDHDYIFAGLANGRLAIYHTNSVLTNPVTQPNYLQIATDKEPIRVLHLEQKSKRLYLGAGAKVHVVRVEPHLDIEESFNTNKTGGSTELISELIVSGKYAHIAKKGKSTIEMWHLSKHKLVQQRDISDFINSTSTSPSKPDSRDARVTSMIHVAKSSLWIGTGGGAICLIDAATYDHLITVNRHASSVRCLAWARVFDQFSMVLSGGLGMNYKCQESDSEADGDHGYLLLWDTDIPQQLKTLRDYDKRRQEWTELNRPEREEIVVEKPTGAKQDEANISAGVKEKAKGGSKLWDLKSRHSTSVEPRYNRRQSQAALLQRNTRRSSGNQPAGRKRASLTPNLEYGRPKRDSMVPGESEAVKHKRKSVQVMKQDFFSTSQIRKQSTQGETMEIGQLLQVRKRSSGALRRQSKHAIGMSNGETAHPSTDPRRLSGIPIPGSAIDEHQNEHLSDLEEDKISGGSGVRATVTPQKRNRQQFVRGSPTGGGLSLSGSPGGSRTRMNVSPGRDRYRRTNRRNSRGATRRDSGGDSTGPNKLHLSDNSNG